MIDSNTLLAPTIKILKFPKVRQYFYRILGSDLSPEEKYQRFIDFLDIASRAFGLVPSNGLPVSASSDAKKSVDCLAARLVQEIDLLDQQQMLQDTHRCVERALKKIRHCQHPDGGWGYQIEASSVWGTVYALWALVKSVGLFATDWDREESIQGGLDWLRQRSAEWALETLPPTRELPLYETAVAVRALMDAGDARVGALRDLLDATAVNLMRSQNPDGGWEARLWGHGCPGPTGIWSEVGATGMALQAVSAWGGSNNAKASDQSELHDRVDRGVNWLTVTQNKDGTWNSGSCSDTSRRPEGVPSVAKTCDGLLGYLAGCEFLGEAVKRSVVDNAVKWILDQESLLTDPHGRVLGWGFKDDPRENLEKTWLGNTITCHVLDTLVRAKMVSISHIWANARWLVATQHKEPGSADDGKWNYGDPFRITLGLIEFYRTIAALPAVEAVFS